MKDGINTAEGQILKLLAQASKIVSHARKHTRAPDVPEEEIKLQAANAMRWSSQVFIILSLLHVSKEKLDILDTMQLTKHEHNCLQDLCDIF